LADPTIADFALVDSAENQLNRFKMKNWVCGYGGYVRKEKKAKIEKDMEKRELRQQTNR